MKGMDQLQKRRWKKFYLLCCRYLHNPPRQDYELILRYLYEEILEKETRVKKVVCDFEIAVWRALRSIIPFADVKG